MLNFLPAPLLGIITALLYLLNTIFWPLPVFAGALLRLIPIKTWQKFCTHCMHRNMVYWADCNSFIQRLTTRIEWDIQGVENLKRDDWYLLISNHISWMDILMLTQVFNRKAPSVRFFMKKELLWTLPVAGLGAWLLDFPFLGRYSKSYLAKHPEMKGKDLETTRKACEKFRNIPTVIIAFAEGTRFTAEKHLKQASPYKHLLRPRAGGVAFTLGAMGQHFHKILNVTLVYPGERVGIWDYFCGRINKIVVRVEELPVTPDLLGDYENDRNYRIYFQNWLNELWRKKDEVIDVVLSKTR
jgi:1-acyl-sn-glycerol-3-phosphate acyltransferase